MPHSACVENGSENTCAPPKVSWMERLFKFEEEFDPTVVHDTFFDIWKYAIYCSVVYLVAIYALRNFMKNREAMQLRGVLVSWNFFLAVFSVVGTFKFFPRLLNDLRLRGIGYTVCSNRLPFHDNVTAIWTLLFTLSKFVELFDTVLIVLRKRPLVFLHYYHHAMTLMCLSLWYTEKVGFTQWFVNVNFSVHSLMYSYYTLRAMNIRLPQAAAMTITLIQIAQMVVGIVVISMAYATFLGGDMCAINHTAGISGLFLCLSFLILFVHFFRRSYLRSKNEKDVKMA